MHNIHQPIGAPLTGKDPNRAVLVLDNGVRIEAVFDRGGRGVELVRMTDRDGRQIGHWDAHSVQEDAKAALGSLFHTAAAGYSMN